MVGILANRTFRHLFAAQTLALLGTGLATVALSLLAWEIAGEDAGLVLGTALAIKMVAYVGLAPIASAFADRVPRRAMLVAFDLIRAIVAAALPFVSETWHVYVLIFLLQAASAGFTPTFQATIPDILPDEADYTRALSLSRLAYDLENLLSPALAALLLTVVSFPALFGGTVAGFAASALLIVTVALPDAKSDRPRGIWERTTRGTRIYLATPRLRGLLALNLAVAAAGAMVIVNTVVIVQGRLGLGESAVALAFASYGAGSMTAALLLPRVLDRLRDRPVMLLGASMLVVGCALGPLSTSLATLVVLWATMGFGNSLVLTPAGRLLRRSSHTEYRPALFAAQFALSHACWLVTYPLAGRLGSAAGLDPTFYVMAGLAGSGCLAALLVWPAHDSELIEHVHDDLPTNHPHTSDGRRHTHRFVIDDFHRRWP